MSVRKLISQPDGVFFITFTCADWLYLFSNYESYDVVYTWFDHLKQKGHYIVGYTIMSNHTHVIIAFRNTGKSINTIVSNGKRFMAYELVARIDQRNDGRTLNHLSHLTSHTEKMQGKIHRVFEPSFDWKECRTREFLLQKLNYLHNNPKLAGLVAQPEDYLHSSARFYTTGIQGIYPVTSYMEVEGINLSVRV